MTWEQRREIASKVVNAGRAQARMREIIIILFHIWKIVSSTSYIISDFFQCLVYQQLMDLNFVGTSVRKSALAAASVD